jgi:hypothetical protein
MVRFPEQKYKISTSPSGVHLVGPECLILSRDTIPHQVAVWYTESTKTALQSDSLRRQNINTIYYQLSNRAIKFNLS